MSFLFIANVNDGILVPKAFSKLIPLLLLSRLQNCKKTQGGRCSCNEQPFDDLKSAFCSTIYISKQRKFVPLFDFAVHFQFALAQKKYRPRFLARSCFDQKCLAILTKPLKEKVKMTTEKLNSKVRKLLR